MEKSPSEKPVSASPSEEPSPGEPAQAPPAQTPSESAGEEAIDRLRTELANKTQEAQELRDKYLRAYAELENFKKRALKDQAEWVKYANESLLRELLTVMDNLRRAQSHAPSSSELSPWVAGVELTVKQFDETLAKFGVTTIKALGQPFDPTVHQAMLQVESEMEEGIIVEELQKGYLLHDRVLRPALVAVAKKKSL
jgi:molecular chaperone GrpE